MASFFGSHLLYVNIVVILEKNCEYTMMSNKAVTARTKKLSQPLG